MKQYKCIYNVALKNLEAYRALARSVHSLYGRWIAQNGHRRDFESALEHVGDLIHLSYALEGSPDFGKERVEFEECKLLSAEEIPSFNAPPERFYDDDCKLNPALDVDGFQACLAPHFVSWIQEGFHPASFSAVLQNLAVDEVYSHEISLSLGGLGGCPSGIEFLTRPRDRFAELPVEATELSRCTSCGDEVEELIGCPDGAEVCRPCFDMGAH